MKKTILKICVGILFATIATGLEARFVTLLVNSDSARGSIISSSEITIAANEVAQVVASGSPGNTPSFWIKDGVEHYFGLGEAQPLVSFPVVIAGPAVVKLKLGSGNFGYGFCTIKIEPESFPPDKTLIIPAGNGALIHVESSTNLIQWLDASPGAYTNVTGNMFFRIRADRIP